MDGTEYIENPNAPTVRVHTLESVDFCGTDTLFTTSTFKRTSAGVWYRETACWLEMPTANVPPAVVMTARKLGMDVLAPVREAVARMLLRLH